MTDNVSLTNRRDALRAATQTLLEKLLKDPDEAGVEQAARQLGMWDEGQVRAGHEEELGALLDYYLFDIEHEGETRIAAFLTAPPADLTDDEKAVLEGFAATRFDVFKIDRSEDGITSLVAPFGGDPVTVYDPELPTMAHGTTVALRGFTADGVGLHTGNAMRLRRRHAKYILDEDAVVDLAKVMAGHEDMVFDTLTHRVLLRAIIAVRAAQGVMGKGEVGIVSKLRRQKRSLGRRSAGRKKH